MMLYGVENHGGGPTKENIRSIHELDQRDDMPQMKMERTDTYFKDMKESGKEFPVVHSDLQKPPSLVLRFDLWTKCPEVVTTLPEK